MVSKKSYEYVYGSINVKQSDGKNFEDEPKKHSQEAVDGEPSVTTSRSSRLIFGTIVLLSVFVWFGFCNDKSNRFPSSNVESPDEGRLPENIPRFFSQKVDHLDPSNTKTWKHRYYAQDKYFKGPGHPIILVVGGEDGNDYGFFYRFIEEHLAQLFGAFVLHPEHRFYGISQPVDPAVATTNDLKQYFTVQQAIRDMLTIVQYYQEVFGCSMDKSSPEYCPVISVGGSYPGFLSAIMRLHFSDVVDIGYASSAPLLLYAMEADQFGYFDVVTRTSEQASPGCADAVQSTLFEVDAALRETSEFLDLAHDKLNICPGSVPSYITSSAMLSEELMLIIGPAFADMNMFNYPPDETTDLAMACSGLFQDDSLDSFEKLAKFWTLYLDENIDPSLPCFDMSSQLPLGPNATISASDWSGVGTGHDGEMFDFHCCATLTPAVGFSKDSMFPYRKWTLDWLTQHCMDRFDVVPDPLKLVREYKFDDLVGQGATRILFTNGMNDLWSAGSHLESLSESLPVINMPNGAHHSELRYTNDDNKDTEDVRQAHEEITSLLTRWLKEIKEEHQS
ncbi:Lysosomal Pro-X carboxypeptidase [Seminavis robusta]|uniref:Lysosomal Pro-X carboxypeptidase n=1 Tax=Seminavis robusta TaxID=568900 RepID=A0A9N8DIH2_9STRA|nr:Lysosomal Pro-X carboxypeptidase [Seminavis robusta]|eukprot:Sro176_g077320.1 Lysosomal Pro-X carboxypeptidase (563) ;mRNA; r:30271-31959